MKQTSEKWFKNVNDIQHGRPRREIPRDARLWAGRIGGKACADAGLFRPRTGLERCEKRVDIILLSWCNSITNKSGKAKRFLRMRSGTGA